MIPEAVLVSACTGSTKTLSANGLKFTDICIIIFKFSVMEFSNFVPMAILQYKLKIER